MKKNQMSALLFSAAMVTLQLFAGETSFANPTSIKIDGSSTVFPITEAMAEEFQSSKKGSVRVTVGISGTGGGFKKFCRGETDVQNASRPIKSEEIAECAKTGIKFIELPIAYDAMVIAVNPKNDWVKEITIADLKKMWEPEAQGKITKWNQVNPKWPDQPLKLYGAGADSGTFDYFTEAIVGKAKASRGDYTASEDDNTLVTGIANDKLALGYMPMSYYEENKAKLKALGVIGGEKAPKKTAVFPSSAAVIDGTYFPMSRPIFIYLNEKSMSRPEVKEFAEYYIKNSMTIVPTVKYVPLPEKAYQLAKERIDKKMTGTMFSGHSEVGLKVEDLLKRESKK